MLEERVEELKAKAQTEPTLKLLLDRLGPGGLERARRRVSQILLRAGRAAKAPPKPERRWLRKPRPR